MAFPVIIVPIVAGAALLWAATKKSNADRPPDVSDIANRVGSAWVLKPEAAKLVFGTLAYYDATPVQTGPQAGQTFQLTPKQQGGGNAQGLIVAGQQGQTILVTPNMLFPVKDLARFARIYDGAGVFDPGTPANGDMVVLYTPRAAPVTPINITPRTPAPAQTVIFPPGAPPSVPPGTPGFVPGGTPPGGFGTIPINVPPGPPGPFTGQPGSFPTGIPPQGPPVDPVAALPEPVRSTTQALLASDKASIGDLRAAADLMQPINPAVAAVIRARADALYASRRMQAASRGGSVFVIRSGDIPINVANYYGGKLHDITAINPGMSFGSPIKGWDVGDEILLPLAWDIENKPLPPVAHGGGTKATAAKVADVLPPDTGGQFGPPAPPAPADPPPAAPPAGDGGSGDGGAGPAPGDGAGGFGPGPRTTEPPDGGTDSFVMSAPSSGRSGAPKGKLRVVPQAAARATNGRRR
jgi:hypothetical protein